VYERAGMVGDCYMFRVDDETVVDATRAGNVARFINHCCEPNCYAAVVELPALQGLRGGKKIVMFARRPIQIGEEVTYDYKFALGAVKVACHCGAPNCMGRMN
jgi:SET domain-containing protein